MAALSELMHGCSGQESAKPFVARWRVLPNDAVSLRYADAVTVGGVKDSSVTVTVKLFVPTFPA